eukprot:6192134-Pleurochrysis_carterae.AAC.1
MCPAVGDPGHAGWHAVPSASLLAASKLRSYMAPGHIFVSSEDTRHWTIGAREAQPLGKPA